MATMSEGIFIILYYFGFFGVIGVIGSLLAKSKKINKFINIILPIEED